MLNKREARRRHKVIRSKINFHGRRLLDFCFVVARIRNLELKAKNGGPFTIYLQIDAEGRPTGQLSFSFSHAKVKWIK